MPNSNLIKSASIEVTAEPAQITCKGEWTVYGVEHVKSLVSKTTWPKATHITVDGSGITDLDTAGAWVLRQLIAALNKKKSQVKLQGFNDEQQSLLELIGKQVEALTEIPERPHMSWLATRGFKTVQNIQQILAFLAFFGEVCVRGLGWLLNPSRILLKPLLHIIETTGYRAIPIIGLLSFLIGIVLAYQMGLQLRNYGADVFVVNLLGLSIFREFAPLITAIIIAGRSGSAFTAQIGTMQVNEEIDILRTMSISPIEQLVLQRILGLAISLPLLTVWSDMTGVLGGMVVANHMLNIGYSDFLTKFAEVIAIKQFVIGLIKTPVFAGIIACIGCFQGFAVTGSAESVGQKTTQSVVQAIFLIICADALFSVLFSWYDL